MATKNKTFLDRVMEAPNVCDLLDDKLVDSIGLDALHGYTEDKGSRAKWEQNNAIANKLAMQVMEQKSQPWIGCSNVKFPLVTVAAMQYQARAYPALINAADLVKAKVYGPDPGGERQQVAERISTHMTWQNIEQDDDWEEEHDKMLLVQAIAGCAFIKRTFDPVEGKQDSHLVLPANLVVNYHTRELEESPRFTETFFLSDNAIRQRIMDGRFRDLEWEPTDNPQQQDPLQVAADMRQGVTPPPPDNATPCNMGEQYTWLDLDEDDYREPYIVTFDLATGRVWRIVARFLPSGITRRAGKIYDIEPVTVYTKFAFIPSPDGGFYDLGLGALLGPINESVNTIFNQVFDMNSLSTLGGGFLGRGFKAKSGPLTFMPGEWKPVDAPGDDLRKSVLPIPGGQATPMLFQLLTFLVGYAERIVSANELQVGENVGQNTPAETARTMDANGTRVYAAIFKRTWRGFKAEYDLQAKLNAIFLEADVDYDKVNVGPLALATLADYRATGIRVRPAADPYVVSDSQRLQQAQTLVQMAQSLPGFNRYRSTLRLLKAMQVPNIEEVYPAPQTQGPNGQPQPAPDFPAPPDPKMIEIQLKERGQQLKELEFVAKQKKDQIDIQMELADLNSRILLNQAKAIQSVSAARNAEDEKQIKLLYAVIEADVSHRDRLVKLLDVISRNMGNKKEGDNTGGTEKSGMAGMGAIPAVAGVFAPPAIGSAGGNGGLGSGPLQ